MCPQKGLTTHNLDPYVGAEVSAKSGLGHRTPLHPSNDQNTGGLSIISEIMDTATDGRRQNQTGGACVRCRDKKLKCDSRRPRCGTCISANTSCEPAAPQVRRGPKKGYLKTLQDQVARLEQQLAEAHGSKDPVVKPSGSVSSPLHIELDPLPMDLEPVNSGPDFLDQESYPQFDNLITPPAELGLAQPLRGAKWPTIVSSPELLMSSLSAGTVSTDPFHLTGPDDSFDFAEGMGQPSTVTRKYSDPSLLQADLLVSSLASKTGAQVADGTL